ncbi:MAG TPA: threonine ammonia-lyase [Candidatus Binatia bacterium]|jgi:threonine dehydratase
MVSFADIEDAGERIKAQIYLSPFPYSETISRMTGSRVYFKLENLQMTGSFKERGALNRLLTLTSDEARRGVIAASAGNHGMAVAFHSRRLGIAATIVMPLQAPLIKVSSVRRYGAQALLYGEDYAAAFQEAQRISNERGLTFIHAFNHPLIIAGQGTIGLELYQQNPDLDAVLVPVGGGGLIAGVALALKTLKPSIRLIGVQAEAIAAMKLTFEQDQIVCVPAAATIADGIAVRAPGEETVPIVKRFVDEIVTVSEGEIANAVLMLLEIEKTVAEGAAATPLAALVNRRVALGNKNVGLIISGGNIDMNLIARIIERGLIQDGRLTRLFVVISDRPGSLARLAHRLASLGANILQINQSRGFGQTVIGETEVELTLETTGRQHIESICAGLRADGLKIKTES